MIRTTHLILRQWRWEDFEPFATMNADPRVMEYFPSTLKKEESTQLAKTIEAKIAERGWGKWAVSVPDVADFIGFIGLDHIDSSILPVHFAPAIEIGWRLAFDFWGKGYAVEGAMACLQYGFEVLALHEIVSFTAVPNSRSRRVMEKIGMYHDSQDDFDHPKLPEGHWLRRHVLYRMHRKKWRGIQTDGNKNGRKIFQL